MAGQIVLAGIAAVSMSLWEGGFQHANAVVFASAASFFFDISHYLDSAGDVYYCGQLKCD